jgi:hypothetical protein
VLVGENRANLGDRVSLALSTKCGEAEDRDGSRRGKQLEADLVSVACNERKARQDKDERRFHADPEPRPGVERLLDQLLVDRGLRAADERIEGLAHDAVASPAQPIVADRLEVDRQSVGELRENYFDVESLANAQPIRNPSVQPEHPRYHADCQRRQEVTTRDRQRLSSIDPQCRINFAECVVKCRDKES